MEQKYTVSWHFEGKEANVKEVYDRLIDELRKIGEIHESPKKSSIHLEHKTGFAGVYPRKSYLLLHFRTDYPIENERIEKQEQLSLRRYKHTLKLDKETQINSELFKWLKDAHHLAG